MASILKGYGTKATPQSRPAGGAQTRNAAGGFVFSTSDEQRLRRFLVLGSERNYYTGGTELTRENAEVVIRMAASNPRLVVDTIVEISTAGRAPKNDQAVFALAIVAKLGNDEGRRYALSKVNEVCRTATMLYMFAGFTQQFGGWGRGLKRAIGNWYTSKDVDKLAYAFLKYRSRSGWMHRDLLRLARPNPGSPEREALHEYLMIKAQGSQAPSERALAKYGDRARSPHTGREIDYELLPGLVDAFEQAQAATQVGTWVALASSFNLSWEMFPDAALGKPEVWEALICKDRGMPYDALRRQLPRLTRLGLTTGEVGKSICAQLTDAEKLKRARVHPINVLVAQRTYASGRSAKGESTWTPTPKITDALDAAFYAAYGSIEPAGNRQLLALDTSGSMGAACSGLPLTCLEAVAAMSLVTVNVEDDAQIVGFNDGRTGSPLYGGRYGKRYTGRAELSRLDVSPRRRLDDVMAYVHSLSYGGTDVSLPMLWAAQNKLDFDAIVIYTDNETWAGSVHPWQALKMYRDQVGHDVKYTVVSMTATGTSVADPNDPSSLDIAGFDSAVPQVLSDFAAGRI